MHKVRQSFCSFTGQWLYHLQPSFSKASSTYHCYQVWKGVKAISQEEGAGEEGSRSIMKEEESLI
jgi:hypothetical protein